MKVLRLEKESSGTYRVVFRSNEFQGISKEIFGVVAEDLTKEVAQKVFRNVQAHYRKSKIYRDGLN